MNNPDARARAIARKYSIEHQRPTILVRLFGQPQTYGWRYAIAGLEPGEVLIDCFQDGKPVEFDKLTFADKSLTEPLS